LAVSKPMVFAVLLGVMVVLALLTIWLLMRFLRVVVSKVRSRFSRGAAGA